MKHTTKLLAVFFSILSFHLIAQTADEIASKHIEAIGGKENWAKIKSIRAKGVIKSRGSETSVTKSQIDKRCMRTDITQMGMSGYSIVTNKEGWDFMPLWGQTKPEPITNYDVKIAQDELWLQDPFITYRESGKTLSYIGKDDVEGTECLKLKMTDTNGFETTFYIDPSNYYIIKKTFKAIANGRVVESAKFFSNYKKLEEGIIYPMSTSSGFGETEIINLEINPTLDESIFIPAAKSN